MYKNKKGAKMQEPNNIDLKDVNKTKKSLKLPKLGNPFKKQNGIKRDAEGKFATTSGGGGLSVAKRINWKRAAPLILIITLLGGMLVFRSFAGGSQQTVTSWYRTCLNSEPDPGGLAYWSGRLDKGEATWAVASAFMAAGHSSSCSYADVPKTGAATPAPKLANTPVTTGGSRTANPLNDAKAWVILSNAHVVNAKKENAATYAISLKNPIYPADVNAVASKEGYVRGAIAQLQTGVGKVSSLYNQAVSNSATKSQGPEILNQLKLLQNNIVALNGYLVNITNDRKRTDATLNANLSLYARLGESSRIAQMCKNAGLPYNAWTRKCGEAKPVAQNCPANITAGSGPVCIKQLQTLMKAGGYYGGAIDGLWGSGTSRAYYIWQTNLTNGGGDGRLPRYSTPSYFKCNNNAKPETNRYIYYKTGTVNVEYACPETGYKAIVCPSGYNHKSLDNGSRRWHLCELNP